MAGEITSKTNKTKLVGNKKLLHKKYSSRNPGGEDKKAADKKAAEEEAERQRLAVEESKVALQKEEDLKLKKQASLALLNDEDKQKDLLAWVRSVPLQQPCVDRIERAFSDGSLVAGIIHHFCPSICDNRQFFRWNSSYNKISNWDALNHKVFPKLGFRLNQKQIANLINPYNCGKFQSDCEQGLFIYKLLDRLRKELAQHNSSVFEYRKSNFIASPCETKSMKRNLENFLENPPFSKVEWLVEQGFYDRNDAESLEMTYPSFPGCKDGTRVNGICLRAALSRKWLMQPNYGADDEMKP